MSMRHVWTGTLGIALVVLAVGQILAADDPQQALTAKGLKKTGTVFVLPDESQIDAKLKDALKVKTTKVAPAQKQVVQVEQVVEGLKKQVERGKRFMDAIEIELPKAPNATKHNEMVSQFNAALKQVEAIEKQVDQYEKQLKDKRTTAMQAAESYSESLLQVRKQYDKIHQRYKELAADKDVIDALAALAKAEPKVRHKLGPSVTFVSTGSKLKNLEEQVFSEAIPIVRTKGGLWTVAVTVGDKPAVEMEVDTGSSSIALPHKVAKELGLEPPADAPVVRCQLANGQVVDGKRVVATRVRVGRFEVANVECTVFGPEYPDAGVLLGQSFLGHFVFKIDAENSRLVMTRLDQGPKDKSAGDKSAGDKPGTKK